MKILLKKIRGAMLLEAALTLPVVCYMIFFTLELIHMNHTQVALNAIAEECTMDYIFHKDSTRFSSIIAKHDMGNDLSNGSLQYDFKVYDSLANVMSSSPYGGMDIIAWNGSNVDDYLPTTNNSSPIKPTTTYYSGKTPESSESMPGHPFILSFVYKYQFSSSFVGKLFNGGTNTKDKKMYLLWARGAGICEGI